jgi:hypothetical protein
VGEVILLILALTFSFKLVNRILNRNVPRVGGEIGPRQTSRPLPPLPDGFLSVQTRAMTLFTACHADPPFPKLKQFLRKGAQRNTVLMHIYRVADCDTDIEIPIDDPGYYRIKATQALALLRELPDPRLVRRLQLSDQPCFLDPWMRKIHGAHSFILGQTNHTGVVVLYRPAHWMTRGHDIGLTLLHEWLHLLAFRSAPALRQFARANRVEPMPQPRLKFTGYGVRNGLVHEAWADLGERLFGDDDETARQVALAAPAHSLVIWRCVESVLRSAPERLRSGRIEVFERRGDFFAGEVAAKVANRDWLARFARHFSITN